MMSALPSEFAYYVAGPMTGLPENNYPAFTQAVATLRRRGLTVLTPTEAITADETQRLSWSQCMRRAVRQLLDADAIVLLPGWEHSDGARLEKRIAAVLGMPVYYWERLL